jgi:hypothetical protein
MLRLRCPQKKASSAFLERRSAVFVGNWAPLVRCGIGLSRRVG